jgi:hypothetical protein
MRSKLSRSAVPRRAPVDNSPLWITPILSDAAVNVPAMTQNWRHLPAPARPIAAAALAAVAAARDHDDDALAGAAGELAGLDPAQVGLILGTTVRVLLEDTHPDGLDGEDVRGVLERCVRSAAAWQSDVDPNAVLVLLAGALGVYEDDGEPAPKPETMARHAALLIADLLGGLGRSIEAVPEPVTSPAEVAAAGRPSETAGVSGAGEEASAGGGEADEVVAAYLTAALSEIERAQLND